MDCVVKHEFRFLYFLRVAQVSPKKKKKLHFMESPNSIFDL